MEKKICVRCEKQINEKKDDWYKTILFNKEKVKDTIYFHRKCYQDFHKDKFQEEFNKKMKQVLPSLGNLFKKKEEIVEYA